MYIDIKNTCYLTVYCSNRKPYDFFIFFFILHFSQKPDSGPRP